MGETMTTQTDNPSGQTTTASEELLAAANKNTLGAAQAEGKK